VAESDAESALETTKPAPDGLRVVARTFDEATPAEYLTHFATHLAKSEKTVALLGRSVCGHLILAQHHTVGMDMNVLLKQVFAQFPGKGGGTRDFARGKLTDAAKADQAVAFAEHLLISR
jgi:alanyl-tRNA synthetase